MVEVYRGSTTKQYLEWYRVRPQEILIETVGPCNLRCIGCPQTLEDYRALKWKPPFMDFGLFKSILLQVKALWKPINVGLYHTGEITLLPYDKFDLYTRTSKEILSNEDGWNSVGFYTNGLLLDSERRSSIVRNKIDWVRLSFDGGDKESYEKVRVGGDFEAVRENALALAREALDADHRMRLEVIFVPYTENERTVDEYHKLWQFSGWQHFTGGSMNYGGLMTEQVSSRRHVGQQVRRKRYSVPCPRIFEQFSVLVDGRVSLCSADPMGKGVLGDLTKDTLREVWEGRRMSQKGVISAHIEGLAAQIDPCSSCDYTDYCAVPDGEFFGEVNP